MLFQIETAKFLWEKGVIHNLGTLPGKWDSAAYSINNAGQIVGTSGWVTTSEAFLWENGVMRDLDKLNDALYTVAVAINDVGQIVGRSGNPINGYWSVPFLWENGIMRNLGSRDYWGEAYDINNAGQVIGKSDGYFLWEKDNMSKFVAAHKINNVGQAVVGNSLME